MSRDRIKVAFLDRDGVINQEVNYLYKISDFKYTPSCIDGLRELLKMGFSIIIVTNQAGIARGYYSEEEYHKLTNWYLSDLRSKGINILDVFYCPHHPEGVVDDYRVDCNCRKPQIGMFQKANEKYSIDTKKSIMIGDKDIDIKFGINSGIEKSFLVSTGHAIENKFNVRVFDNLLTASNYIRKYL